MNKLARTANEEKRPEIVKETIGEQADLADVSQLIPGLACPVFASRVDPVLHLGEAGLDILPIAEAAALTPQQQLVEELHVHKAEQLLEQLPYLQQ